VWAGRVDSDKKGIKMTTVRRKAIMWATVILVALALIVLPGCSRQPTKTGAPARDPAKGME